MKTIVIVVVFAITLVLLAMMIRDLITRSVTKKWKKTREQDLEHLMKEMEKLKKNERRGNSRARTK